MWHEWREEKRGKSIGRKARGKETTKKIDNIKMDHLQIGLSGVD
jgi:hypothetical protein